MSPEQARGQPDIDARSDVWSLGMVLYELLSAELPWGGVTSLGDLMVAIITAELPAIQTRAPWVSASMAAIVQRALERDPAARFADAGELRDALYPLSGDGGRLLPELLVGLPAEQRSRIAPRATTTYGISSTSGAAFARTDVAATAPARRGRAAWWAAGFAVLAGLGAGAAGIAHRLNREASGQQPAQAEPAPIASPSVSAPEQPAPALRFVLAVPAADSVQVDGRNVNVIDGGVPIEGAPGAVRKIALVAGGKRSEHTVAITEVGLVPSRLEPPSPTPRPVSDPKNVEAEKPQARPKPTPASAKTAAPKPPPGIAQDTSEF
jgi:serine/threonine-protein kinase